MCFNFPLKTFIALFITLIDINRRGTINAPQTYSQNLTHYNPKLKARDLTQQSTLSWDVNSVTQEHVPKLGLAAAPILL